MILKKASIPIKVAILSLFLFSVSVVQASEIKGKLSSNGILGTSNSSEVTGTIAGNTSSGTLGGNVSGGSGGGSSSGGSGRGSSGSRFGGTFSSDSPSNIVAANFGDSLFGSSNVSTGVSGDSVSGTDVNFGTNVAVATTTEDSGNLNSEQVATVGDIGLAGSMWPLWLLLLLLILVGGYYLYRRYTTDLIIKSGM